LTSVTNLAAVLRSSGRLLTIFALCIAIGLHWLAVQSVAWTAMIVENAKAKPLSVAIAQTFDGAHPCSLCHAVNTGTHPEKKSDIQPTTPQIDMICSVRVIRLATEFVPNNYPPGNFFFSEHGESPPVPPPRELVA
jgi:hypothetical protein